MFKWTETVTNQAGIAVSGASLTVYKTGTSNLATLYSDDGVTTTSNPVTTDSLGTASFYVDDGRYDLTISGTGLTTKTRSDLEIFDWKSKPASVAHMYFSSDFGSCINSALATLPSTGGVVDARGLQGTQTVSTTITVSKPVHILLPAGTVTAAAGVTMFTISQNLALTGQGAGGNTSATGTTDKATTKLVTASGQPLVAPSGVNVKSLQWRDFAIQGGGGASTVISTADYVNGVTDYASGHLIFENLDVHDFTGAMAFFFGQSSYYQAFRNCKFANNLGSLDFGKYSEPYVDNCQFNDFVASGAAGSSQVVMRSHSNGRITNSFFECDNTLSNVQYGVKVAIAGSNTAGYVYIGHNKFGPEGSSANFVRVNVEGDSGSNAVNINIHDNHFAGSGSGETAIKLTTMMSYSQIHNNFFNNLGTIINDAYTIATNLAGNGGNTFKGNVFYALPTGTGIPTYTVFTNGGRGFTDIEGISQWSADQASRWRSRPQEPLNLQNLIANSEDLSSFTANAVTVTTGQADRYSGTRGAIVQRTTTGGDNLTVSLGTLSRDTLVIKFDAKQGTTSILQVEIQNAGAVVARRTFLLTADWEEYAFPVCGIPTSGTTALYFIPNSLGTVGHNVYLARPQAAYWDSDYYPTTGSTASSTTYGHRYERGLLMGGSASLAFGATGKITMGANGLILGNPLVTLNGTSTPDASQGNNILIGNVGATNITNFTNGVLGQTIMVINGNTNQTFKHSGGVLNLKGAADTNPPTNGVLYFFLGGGGWVETGRSY